MEMAALVSAKLRTDGAVTLIKSPVYALRFVVMERLSRMNAMMATLLVKMGVAVSVELRRVGHATQIASLQYALKLAEMDAHFILEVVDMELSVMMGTIIAAMDVRINAKLSMDIYVNREIHRILINALKNVEMDSILGFCHVTMATS